MKINPLLQAYVHYAYNNVLIGFDTDGAECNVRVGIRQTR